MFREVHLISLLRRQLLLKEKPKILRLRSRMTGRSFDKLRMTKKVTHHVIKDLKGVQESPSALPQGFSALFDQTF